MDSFKSRVADLMEDLDFAFDDDHILLETMLEAPYHTVPCWPRHFITLQFSDEPLNAFVGRLKSIHLRAFPNIPAAESVTHNLLA